jgi:L-threonylcarbamoyladenylate synthase
VIYWTWLETVLQLNRRRMTAEISRKVQVQIENGIAILKQGGLVAYPTDTVYGLGAYAYLSGAVKRIYDVKERPRDMPLPLLLADENMIADIAAELSPLAWLLIKEFLPGALTLVVSKSIAVPRIVGSEGPTIAVRIPAHPVPVALIRGMGAPIIGTSANLSGKPSPLTAEEVNNQLGDRVDLVIDGGKCPGGKESTVVDVTGDKPVILREGAISTEEIERVCGVSS